MEIFYFERLNVWKAARVLNRQIYGLTRSFPAFEQYALGDQMRRATVSVCSNIAESSGRLALKDRLRFLNFSYGSLTELRCQIILAQDLGYTTEEATKAISENLVEIAKMISGMRKNMKEE